MSVKSQSAADYLAAMKAEHGRKPHACRANGFLGLRVLMTGDGRPGSIGECIRIAVKARGAEVSSFPGDVREPVPLPLGRSLNALIMCHGVTHLDWIEEAPTEELLRVAAVNFWGTVNISQAFVRETIGSQVRKTIVSIGSMAYKAILNGSAAYCGSKAGAAHYMRCLAWELAPKGYDVFVIHPSNVDGTPMSEETIQGLMRYRSLSRAEAEAYWGDSYLRERGLSRNEIADLAVFLLSGNAPHLSGAQLELSGGQR